MARYIDANDLVRAMTLQANRSALGEIAPPQLSYSEMLEIIADAPTADVAEIVRCKDCRHWYSPNNDDAHYCRIAHGLNGIVAEEDFCSYGRR